MKIRRLIELLEDCEKELCGKTHDIEQGDVTFFLAPGEFSKETLIHLLNEEDLIRLDIPEQNKNDYLEVKHNVLMGCHCCIGATIELDLHEDEK